MDFPISIPPVAIAAGTLRPGHKWRGLPQSEFPENASAGIVSRLFGTVPFKLLKETLNWSRG
nr:hypothetical protein Iba_chr06fCG7640 [Ipomoea batatas]